MDQVKIRAAVSAHGMVKGQEATVAETPTVAGAIRNGFFMELERFTDAATDFADLDDDAEAQLRG